MLREVYYDVEGSRGRASLRMTSDEAGPSTRTRSGWRVLAQNDESIGLRNRLPLIGKPRMSGAPVASLLLLRQTGVFSGEGGNRTPVEVLHATADCSQHVGMHPAGEGHGRLQGFGSTQRQAHILQAKAHFEASGLVALVSDDPTIIFVNWRGE